MRRSSDRPSTVPEALRSSRVGMDELARRQGRGSTALRNQAGHVLALDPTSVNPLLRPQQLSGQYVTGMSFDKYGVRVVNPDYPSGNGDLTVNAFATQDYISAGRTVYAGGEVRATGAVTGGGVVSNGTATVNGQINMGYNPVYCGDVHGQIAFYNDLRGNVLNLNGQINMGLFPIYTGDVNCQTVFYRGLVNASSPKVKERVRPAREVLGRPMLDIVRSAPVSVFQYRADEPAVAHMAGTDELGLMADAVPPLLRERFHGPRKVDRQTGRETVPEVDGINLQRVVSVLWGAVGELAEEAKGPAPRKAPKSEAADSAAPSEVAQLRSQVDSQSQQIDALVAEIGQLRTEINELRGSAA